MSAWMCSDRHLTALAAYAVRNGLAQLPEAALPDYPSAVMLKSAIKQIVGVLARENVESLDARYPGDTGRDVSAVDPSAVPDGIFPLIAIIKACHCYAYQSCEHTGWEASRAKQIVERIEAHALRALPGYDAAPWGL